MFTSRLDYRGCPWTLRAAALVLTVLGVYPMANRVALGPGLPWWTPTAIRWVLWTIGLGTIAAAVAKAFPRTAPKLRLTTRKILLRPTPRTFALSPASAQLVFRFYAAVAVNQVGGG